MISRIFRILYRRYRWNTVYVLIILLQAYLAFIVYYAMDYFSLWPKCWHTYNFESEIFKKSVSPENWDYELGNNAIEPENGNHLHFSVQKYDKDSQEIGILPCRITREEALSAIKRTKTLKCKKKIVNIACEVEKDTFYPSRLPSFCPTFGRVRGKSLGCFRDDMYNRTLNGFSIALDENSPSICADFCLQRGFIYSGVEYSYECYCGNMELPDKLRVSEKECSMTCEGTQDPQLRCGGDLLVSVVETGLGELVEEPIRSPSTDMSPTVRIAYILILSSRSLRQIYRLFKAIYHVDHYFFIHVDLKQQYLYRELLQLERTFPNVVLSRTRFSCTWGGGSILKSVLHCMKELVLKENWRWDFVINLSESDFPIQTNLALVNFLTAHKERNFVSSHHYDTHSFIQTQGFDQTFVECDNFVWQIGNRTLPLGIRIDGGSDWVVLQRQFVEYITMSDDALVTGLRRVFSYTLMSSETFFHTVLRNSEYCQTFMNNNLRVINWDSKLSCNCLSHKNTIDWCGCSPLDFTPDQWDKFAESEDWNVFFARKFEAVKSHEVINMVDEWLYGKYDPKMPNLRSYWENVYHSQDPPTGKNDVSLTLYNSAMRFAVKELRREALETASEDSEVIPVVPTHAHSFHVNDRFEGLTVEFIASNGPRRWNFEAFIQPKRHLMIDSTIPSLRVTNMEVNMNVDLKEQMFRNFGGQLGPEDELTVAVWLTPVAASQEDSEQLPEEEEEDKGEAAVVVLVDPLDAAAARKELVLSFTKIMVTCTFSFNGPLRPGMWKAYLFRDSEMLASLLFPILPSQFVDGKLITMDESRRLHGGQSVPYVNITEDTLDLLKNVRNNGRQPRLFPGYNTSLEEANRRALFTLPELFGWIDEVVNEFYSLVGICAIDDQEFHACLEVVSSQCSSTSWSSHSPDPKSQLGPVDPQTGRLIESFRVQKSS